MSMTYFDKAREARRLRVIKDKARKVKMVVFDVDGVLTDGGIYVGATGELFKPFYCRDGLAITLAQRVGLKTAIITGRESEHVKFRANELKIDAVWQGNPDKRAAYDELKEKFSLADEEIAYIGDDIIDLPVMLQVGLPMAVGDAVPEVKSRAALVADAPGGRGAVRELLEFILKAQGKWDGIVESYVSATTEDVSDLMQ